MTATLHTSHAPHHPHPGDRLGELGGRLSARRQSVRKIISASLSDKRAQTQTLLLAAGRELFTDKGIGATSVGDICSRAGFTRGAFYSNFTDMDHFVRQLAQEEWTAMAQFVRGAVDEVLPDAAQAAPSTDAEVQQALAALASRILRVTPVSREFYLLHNELVAYIVRESERSAPIRAAYQEFRSAMCEVLVNGMAAIGRECLLSPEDTTELIFAAVDRSMRVALLAEPAPAEGGATRAEKAPAGEGREGTAAEGAEAVEAAENAERSEAAKDTPRVPLLTDQLDRTLPVLLTHLSRPVRR